MPMKENIAFLFKATNSLSIMSFSRGVLNTGNEGRVNTQRKYFLRFAATSGYLCSSSRSNLRPKRRQRTIKMIHMIVSVNHRKTYRRITIILSNL